MRRISFRVTLLLALGLFPVVQRCAWAQTQSGPTEIKIGGAVTMPLVLSLSDAKKMPRKTLSITDSDSRNQKVDVYEGVALETLLSKAGAPTGDQIRGTVMASYVLIDAADGYRALFSLAELDSGFLDSEVLLADTLNGAPLGAGQGPFKVVAPHEKRPARWVRMVKSVTLVRVPENQNQ